MGKQLFIPRSFQTAEDTNFDADDLGAGEAALCYVSDANLVAIDTSDASDVTLTTPMQVIWRKYNTSDMIEASFPWTFGEMVKSTKIADSTGTAQVITISDITDVIPAAQATGDVFNLKIIQTTPSTANLKKWNIEVPFEGTDFTEITLCDAIDAAIDTAKAADSTLTVTASNTDTAVVLTADYTSDHFRVACDGDLAGATITYTTDSIPATGAYASIKALETKLKSHGEGITNTIWFPKEYTSETDNTKAYYDQYIFDFNLKTPAKHGMNGTNDRAYTLYICEPSDTVSSDSVGTAINTIHGYLEGVDSLPNS